MSTMLEQALVDAAALKDAALKKAELAVLEDAKPKIEERLRKLFEAEGEEDELDALMGDEAMGGAPVADMGAGEVGDVAGGLSMGITDGEKMCPCPDQEEEIEIDFGELERQMAADEQSSDEMGQADLAQDLNLSAPGDELGASMEPEEEEEEFDLSEETLAALFEETEVDEACSPNKKMTHAEYTHKGDLDDDDDTVEEAKMSPEMRSQMSADAHADFMKNKGAQAPTKPAPKHKSMGQEFELDPGDDKELELAREAKIQEKIMEAVRSVAGDLIKELEEKRTEVKDLKGLLKRLSEQVKKVNLQSARLLYTNQILESVSLNERQKKNIVEAVSKAGSVEQAKVIYETLINSAGNSKKKKKPQSLTEAVEKRSTPLFPRRNKPENVSDPAKDRMQKLAGIK